MTVSISDTSEELMTRQQVAYLFRDTSAAVAKWAGAKEVGRHWLTGHDFALAPI